MGELLPSVVGSLSGHASDANVVGPWEAFLVLEDDQVSLVGVDAVRLVAWIHIGEAKVRREEREGDVWVYALKKP
jgi:hypothetical protein